MKRLRSAALALAILAAPLGGCGVLQNATGAVPTVQLRATQAEFVAESTFAASSKVLEASVDSGVLKGPAAAKAKVLYDESHDALLAMRQALAVGNSTLAAAEAQQSINTSSQLNALAKGS